MRPVRHAARTVFAVVVGFGLVRCSDSGPSSDGPLTPLPTVAATDAQLRRLTIEQYINAVHDVLGDDLIVSKSLEPDVVSGGLVALGAARTSISSWGVERYETTAFDVAEQALNAERRDRLMSCSPTGAVDIDCASAFVQQIGRRLWRRPLTEAEARVWVDTATTSAQTLGDFYTGLEFALAGLLQSPNFLYRFERPEPVGLDDWSLATRLSFFLWNTTPDEALLDAAASGALATDTGFTAQVERLMTSPQARAGVRAFFSDLFELHRLDELAKDPTRFVHYDAELGPAAREQTLLDLEQLIFDLDGDYRDFFTSRQTHVDRRLAAIYSVPAPVREGFGQVELPASDGRRGFLGQVSFLALHSHAVATSAVLRGRFVRTVLLCGRIPPPPVDLNTACRNRPPRRQPFATETWSISKIPTVTDATG